MIEAPEAPILLLHSTCRGDYETTASSDGEPTIGDADDVGDVGGDALDRFDLMEQPIVCDLLLLPEYHTDNSYEHSTSSSSSSPSSTPSLHHEHLHFSQNPINPCGISNVLTLENLPESWKTGPVLLSLTSCSIFYPNDNDGDGNDDGESTPNIPLPVEPTPSTFVLDFGYQEVGASAVDIGGGGSHDSITIGKKLTEIVVEFDVSEASKQADELLLLFLRRRRSKMSKVEDEETEISEVEDDAKNHTEQQHTQNSDSSTRCLQDDGAKGKEEEEGQDPFYHDRPKLEDISQHRLFGAPANRNYEEQKLLLAHLNVRMEHDTRTMDLVLHTCCFVGLFLMAILLWAIHQYYRSTFKSIEFSQEVRESMKQTRGVLQEAVDGLHQYTQQQQQQQ